VFSGERSVLTAGVPVTSVSDSLRYALYAQARRQPDIGDWPYAALVDGYARGRADRPNAEMVVAMHTIYDTPRV